MVNLKLLKHIIIFLLVIVFLDYIAYVFYLHWTLWWYDVILHFLGGFTVGMTSLVLLNRFRKISSSKLEMIIFSFISALLVGIAWEFYELLFGITSLGNGIVYFRDTGSDLIMDICGGFFGALYSLSFFSRD